MVCPIINCCDNRQHTSNITAVIVAAAAPTRTTTTTTTVAAMLDYNTLTGESVSPIMMTNTKKLSNNKKGVQFATQHTIIEIIHINDIPADVHADIWFTRDEFKILKQEQANLISKYEAKKSCKNESIRGLENRIGTTGRYVSDMIRNSRNAVFTEQDLQIMSMIDEQEYANNGKIVWDPIQISNEYTKETQHALAIAIRNAQKDEQDVQKDQKKIAEQYRNIKPNSSSYEEEDQKKKQHSTTATPRSPTKGRKFQYDEDASSGETKQEYNDREGGDSNEMPSDKDTDEAIPPSPLSSENIALLQRRLTNRDCVNVSPKSNSSSCYSTQSPMNPTKQSGRERLFSLDERCHSMTEHKEQQQRIDDFSSLSPTRSLSNSPSIDSSSSSSSSMSPKRMNDTQTRGRNGVRPFERRDRSLSPLKRSQKKSLINNSIIDEEETGSNNNNVGVYQTQTLIMSPIKSIISIGRKISFRNSVNSKYIDVSSNVEEDSNNKNNGLIPPRFHNNMMDDDGRENYQSPIPRRRRPSVPNIRIISPKNTSPKQPFRGLPLRSLNRTNSYRKTTTTTTKTTVTGHRERNCIETIHNKNDNVVEIDDEDDDTSDEDQFRPQRSNNRRSSVTIPMQQNSGFRVLTSISGNSSQTGYEQEETFSNNNCINNDKNIQIAPRRQQLSRHSSCKAQLLSADHRRNSLVANQKMNSRDDNEINFHAAAIARSYTSSSKPISLLSPSKPSLGQLKKLAIISNEDVNNNILKPNRRTSVDRFRDHASKSKNKVNYHHKVPDDNVTESKLGLLSISLVENSPKKNFSPCTSYDSLNKDPCCAILLMSNSYLSREKLTSSIEKDDENDDKDNSNENWSLDGLDAGSSHPTTKTVMIANQKASNKSIFDLPEAELNIHRQKVSFTKQTRSKRFSLDSAETNCSKKSFIVMPSMGKLSRRFSTGGSSSTALHHDDLQKNESTTKSLFLGMTSLGKLSRRFSAGGSTTSLVENQNESTINYSPYYRRMSLK